MRKIRILIICDVEYLGVSIQDILDLEGYDARLEKSLWIDKVEEAVDAFQPDLLLIATHQISSEYLLLLHFSKKILITRIMFPDYHFENDIIVENSSNVLAHFLPEELFLEILFVLKDLISELKKKDED